MCMMIYSPEGKPISGNLFRHIDARNNDGIGIMANGMASRFLGKRQVRDALAMMRALSDTGVPYGLHFRWATQGGVHAGNVHPFAIPETDLYLMHNGVLDIDVHDPRKSDTATFAERDLAYSPGLDATDYWCEVGDYIGCGNKLLLMDGDGGFRIVNEYLGEWIDGIWYSQTYSLPASMRPRPWPMTGVVKRATALVNDPEFSWEVYK